VLDSLNQRLDPPEQIAIDVRGRTVTLHRRKRRKSHSMPTVASGLKRRGTGRTIRARATLNANQLIVSSTGDSGNDFTVTFQPIDSQHLKVIAGLCFRPITADSGGKHLPEDCRRGTIRHLQSAKLSELSEAQPVAL